MARKPPSEIISEFFEQVRAGEKPVALFHNANSPTVVELLGTLGQRVMIFDQQHTSCNHESLVHLIRTAELFDMLSIVRIAGKNPVDAIKALDAGAHGVWVEYIDSAEELREFSDAIRFPLEGSRGYCTFPRACQNGLGDFTEFLEYSNAQPFLVVGLNTEEALNDLDAILAVSEVSCFSGSFAEVSVRAGYSGWTEVMQQHAIAKAVNKKIHEAGKLIMAPFWAPDMGNIEESREFFEEEFVDFFFTGDIGCLARGFGQLQDTHKKIVAPAEQAESDAEDTGDSENSSESWPRTCG